MNKINPLNIWGYNPEGINSHPDLRNPRITRNQTVIDEIIHDKGHINEPLVLSEAPDGSMVLVDGYSRLTGYLEYSKQEDSNPPDSVPCRFVDWVNAPLYAVRLNLQSGNKTPLNDFELAQGVKHLEDTGFADDQIALALSSSKRSGMILFNTLKKLLNGSPALLSAYSDHKIELPTTKMIVKLPVEEQEPMVARVIELKAEGVAESDIRKSLLGKKANKVGPKLKELITDTIERHIYFVLNAIDMVDKNPDYFSRLDWTDPSSRSEYLSLVKSKVSFTNACNFLQVSGTLDIQMAEFFRLAVEVGLYELLTDAIDGYSVADYTELASKANLIDRL